MKKILLKIVCIIIFLPILLVIINAFSVIIPNKNIQNNIIESLPILKDEGNYYNQIKPNYGYFNGYQYDNYTDSLILTVAFDSKDGNINPFKRSTANYICETINPTDCLEKVTTDSTINDHEYSRYWFGTSYVVRFLLLFLNLVELRYLNLIVVFTLLTIFIILLYKRTNIYQCIFFVCSFCNIGLFILPFSLQLLPNFLISIISSIIILYYCDKKAFNSEYILYLFLIIGMLTSYFDLLTYPLVTFGIPFIIHLLTDKQKQKKQRILKYILLGILWIIGYIIPFIFKFVYSSVVLNKNVIKSSLDQILFRTSTGTKITDRINGVKSNLYYVFNDFNILIIKMYYIYYLYKILKNKMFKINYVNLLSLIGVGILPLIWYMLMVNHSIIHSFMTYRISIITFVCLLEIPIVVFSKKSQK